MTKTELVAALLTPIMDKVFSTFYAKPGGQPTDTLTAASSGARLAEFVNAFADTLNVHDEPYHGPGS